MVTADCLYGFKYRGVETDVFVNYENRCQSKTDFTSLHLAGRTIIQFPNTSSLHFLSSHE